MIGKIFITGLIGSIESEKGVELLDVIEQVKKQPLAESFNVYINSEGGVVDVGFDIYDYLSNIDKPITTIANGLCASIATVIYMAGSKRIINSNCKFMVHLPMIMGDYMNSKDMEGEIDSLKKLETTLVSFYNKTAGIEKEAIYPLMKNETFLSAEQAVTLGFATESQKEFKAVAYFKQPKINKQMSETKINQDDKNWLENQFTKIMKAFPTKKVNLILQDENGAEVNFDALDEDATPAIGDVAVIDGEPANGSYIMPSLGGVTAVFSEGILTEIIEVEDDAVDEMAALKSENERLTNELSTQVNAVAELNGKVEAYVNLEKEVKEFKRQVVGKFNVDATVPTKEPKINALQERLNKLKKNR